MTIPKAAIEKAIEGGWAPCEFTPYVEVNSNGGKGLTAYWWFKNEEGEGCGFPEHHIVLMPEFWQALGKASDWLNEMGGFHGNASKHHDCTKCNAFRFYDLILTGGDTEKFWAELLP